MTAIQAIIGPRWDTITLLGHPLSAAVYDGDTHGSGVSDPTPKAAAQLRWAHELEDDIYAAADLAHKALRKLRSDLDRVPSDIDLSAIRRQHTCQGGSDSVPKPEGWELVGLCDRIVGEYTQTGLCDRCRQRRDEWRRKESAA